MTLLLLAVVASLAAEVPVPTADEIVSRMMAADDVRTSKLGEYSSVRHYSLENQRFGVRATMTALAASTWYVRRMADGRWEVTAKGWKHHNFLEQQRQAHAAGLIDAAGQDTGAW